MAWNPERPRQERLKGSKLFNMAKAWAYAKNEVSPPSFRGVQPGTGMSRKSDGRVKAGLLCEWWFDEGKGKRVLDRTPGTKETSLALVGAYDWLQDTDLGSRHYLDLSATGKAVNRDIKELDRRVPMSQGFSFEAWVRPANDTQAGPARIATISDPQDAANSRNFMLGQDATMVKARARSVSTNDDGFINLATPTGVLSASALSHVVLTVKGNDATQEVEYKIYVDGVVQANEELAYVGVSSSDEIFSNWDTTYHLTFGNETGSVEDHPWEGGIYLSAFYKRALSEAEVLQNFGAEVSMGVGDVSATNPSGGGGGGGGGTTYDFYVDAATGNDSNDGSEGSPWATAAKALTATGTVGFKAGSYGDILEETDPSRSSKLTLAAIEGESVVFGDIVFNYGSTTQCNIRLEGLELTSDYFHNLYFGNATDIEVVDCEIHPTKWSLTGTGRNAIRMDNCSDVVVSGCDIYDAYHGVEVGNTANITILGNKIGATQGDCITYKTGNTNGLIERNHLYGLSATLDGDEVSNPDSNIIAINSGDVSIRNNHMNGAGHIGLDSGIRTWSTGASVYNDVVFENNMMYDIPDTIAVHLQNAGTIEMRNNFWFARGKADAADGCSDGLEKKSIQRYNTALYVENLGAGASSYDVLELYNNIMIGDIIGIDHSEVLETNNYLWCWKVTGTTYVDAGFNGPSGTSFIIADSGDSSCSRPSYNPVTDGSWFDPQPVMQTTRVSTFEWNWASGAHAEGKGSLAHQPTDCLGDLDGDGFVTVGTRSTTSPDPGPKQHSS